MKTIRVMIDVDGRATVEADGVQGKECTELTKPIEEFLGGLSSREYKACYHKEPDRIQPKSQERMGY